VVADPPWTPALGSTWKTRFTDKARPQKHYDTLSVDELCALPVPAATQSHLWLWVLNQHMDWGYEVARAWGFEPWNVLTWCKPGLGTGRFQCNTEHVLVCRKGVRHGNPFGGTGGTWFEWPRGRHSEKPQEFYDLVELVSPGPRLELFSRRVREGWDGWGLEYPGEKGVG
jgi:N6-adenosine-specific RNA methylase IME4